jgi:hypothetical protein
MTTSIGSGLLGGAVGALIVVGIAMLFGLPALADAADDHPGLAGWVQAVFSAAAVFAAIGVAAWQGHSNRVLVRQQLAAGRRLVLEPINGLIDVATGLADEAQDSFVWLEWTWRPELFIEVEKELSQVQIVSLGDAKAVVAFMSFRKAFSDLLRVLRSYLSSYQEEEAGNGPGPHFEDDTDWIAQHRQRVFETHQVLTAELVRLRSERAALNA